MGARKTVVAGLLLAALAVITPAPAAADEDLSASGSLTYAWHGDPAHGCAQAGVCGIRGTISLQISDATFAVDGRHGGQFDVNQAEVTVRASDGHQTCIDMAPGSQIGNGGGVMPVAWRAGPAVRVGLILGLSSGRCAGPAPGDLDSLVLAGTRAGARHPRFDLHGSLPFVAGPYSGTLTSTLRLAPSVDSSLGGSSSSSGAAGPGAPPPVRHILIEQVALAYQISVPDTSLTVSFRGENDPFCAAAGSCGASGSLSLAVPAAQGEFTVTATRPVRHPVGRRQALADFRAGKMSISSDPLPVSIVTVAETYANPDGLDCSDSVASNAAAIAGLGPITPGVTGRMVPVSSELPMGVDFLRTHCPGPSTFDVLPDGIVGPPSLVTGQLTTSQLLHRHITLELANTGSFSGPGYVGARSGRFPVSLTLVSVRTSTQHLTEPVGP